MAKVKSLLMQSGTGAPVWMWAKNMAGKLLALDRAGLSGPCSQYRFIGTKESKRDISCRIMIPTDEAGVKSQLYDGYFRDEPISKALKFDRPRECRHLVDPLVAQAIGDEVTTVAVDQNNGGRVAGVLLCHLVTPHNDKMPFCSSEDPDNRKMCIKLGIWEKLHEGVNLFEKYNAHLGLHIVFASVQPEYANQGLLNTILENSLKEALKKGAVFVYAEVSSNYSYQEAVAWGCEMVKRIPLDNYTDIDVGQTVAGNTGEHKECVLIATKILPLFGAHVNK